ncbi:SusC/RagA family TonB-linked outer membrane protein [Saccharicrinis fermentans]|uniref:TonB-linked outer membrane protein, SusC/RagA family n=1 Tax=Saccharicrinis fermentans DSM 9555 = JCM 21142 TaxID=869213 RepID=W7YKY9_9BACT|nr:SusC/RagA family TonB-linked outer membrane protein [Saccharicrinis fermentans]GAF03029.1 TonB-linked outer membrane protein, SusC/RagA family [Saccharicrinis fermentans DSM 9555 = JCM 21142]
MKQFKFKCLLFFSLTFFAGLNAFAQHRTIKGKVISKDGGEELVGVNVIVKDLYRGSITDIKGNYTVKIPNDPNVTLVFTFIGMKTQEVLVGDKTTIDIVLLPENNVLGEALVVGYGSVKSRESLVGSVVQVKSAELLKYSNALSVDQMLEGQVAGVYLESEDGNPTTPVKVRIRGNNSLPDLGTNITASSEPLYILDGVPLIDALNPNIDQVSGATADEQIKINPMALVNPEDIESVSILKDASAAAIYGANAANGVIIITTKKGVKGKTRVSLSHKTLISNPINKVQYLNTDQFVELSTEFYRNSGYNDEDIADLVGRTDVYTDWGELSLQNAMSHHTNVSLSGGSDKTTYRLSFGYKDNETTSKGNDSEAITSRLSLNTELVKGVRLSYNGGISTFKSDKYAGFATYAFKPNIPVYDDEGNYTKMDSYANPLADLEQNINQSEKFYTNNSLKLDVNITKNFKSSSLFGIDYTNTKQFTFYSKENGKGADDGGYLKEKRSVDNNWVSYSQFEYKGAYKKHNLGATAGIQLKHDESNSTTADENNLITEKILLLGQSKEDADSEVKSSESENAMRSYYGRLNYDFGKKYFMSINYRADASSYFGGDQQVENFASIGGAWIISKENFWVENELISFLKLKTSYGKLGNAKVGTYSAKGLYSYNTSSNYNGKLVATPYSAPNEALGWQTSYKLNLGLTAKLLGRFNLGIEYYNNKTKDGILSLHVPPETGWNSISVNTADFTNYGVEFTLDANNIKLGEIKWKPNFNIGFNRNRLDRLTSYAERLTTGQFSGAGLRVGESTSLVYGYKYAGVNPDNGNPIWYMQDGTVTEDYSTLKSDTNERVVIGKSNPDFNGGFSNSFSYKGFNFNFMIAYEYGAEKFISYAARDMEKVKTLYLYNKSVNLMDRWQEPGDITDIPRLAQDIPYVFNSSRYLYDQSNVSLRSISLNYNLSRELCKSIKLANASIGISISNVYTWYKEGTQADRNGMAEYRYTFPQSRTFAFQLKLGI